MSDIGALYPGLGVLGQVFVSVLLMYVQGAQRILISVSPCRIQVLVGCSR